MALSLHCQQRQKWHTWLREKQFSTEPPLPLFLQFSKTFLLDYRFEEVQKLQFVVYDVDDKKRVDDARKHDLIGSMECTLADVVTAGQQYTRNLRKAGTGREGEREGDIQSLKLELPSCLGHCTLVSINVFLLCEL